MQLEAGKFYRTESGRIVGPLERHDSPAHDTGEELFVAHVDGRTKLWRRDGRNLFNKDAIISEHLAGPVRSITRKEILPGTYDCGEGNDIEISCVRSHGVAVKTDYRFGAPSLRRAAQYLNEIADALDAE